MEFLDLYDKNRIKLGAPVERGSKFPPNNYHIVICVCLINSKEQMLIQKRQTNKKKFPNKWDISVEGSVVAGEDSATSAEREVLEELGCKIDFSNERPYFTINHDSGFFDYYLIKKDIELTDLVLQQEEVQCAKWATKQEILKMVDDGSFIPYHHSVMDMIFDMSKCRGSYKL